jgi:hypothetical protein
MITRTIGPPSRERPEYKQSNNYDNRGNRYGKGETGKDAACSPTRVSHDFKV